MLDDTISEDEIKGALLALKAHKSAGDDGVPAEAIRMRLVVNFNTVV